MCEQCLNQKAVLLMFANEAADRMGYDGILDGVLNWKKSLFPMTQIMNQMVYHDGVDVTDSRTYADTWAFLCFAHGRTIDMKEMIPFLITDPEWREKMTHEEIIARRREVWNHPYMVKAIKHLHEKEEGLGDHIESWATSSLTYDELIDLAEREEMKEPDHLPSIEEIMNDMPQVIQDKFKELGIQLELLSNEEGVITFGASIPTDNPRGIRELIELIRKEESAGSNVELARYEMIGDNLVRIRRTIGRTGQNGNGNGKSKPSTPPIPPILPPEPNELQ